MANFPSLYTTEVQNNSSSEASGEFEILGPHSEHLVGPTQELKNFGKFLPLEKLTREGREKVKSLRPNLRREGLLEQNPNTPVTDTAQIQEHFNTPIQPQSKLKTKGALQKLWQALSLTESQYQFRTPTNNPRTQEKIQEQTDFSVPTQNIVPKNRVYLYIANFVVGRCYFPGALRGSVQVI